MTRVHQPAFLALGMLLMAGGCQQDMTRPAPAAPAAQAVAAPAARFDGVYRGTFRLTRNSGQCGATVIQRTMSVANGQARVVYDTDQGFSASGAVNDDGRFELVGRGASAIIRIQGQIQGNQAIGTFESRNCGYDIHLSRGTEGRRI